jgi:hypothetical protein
VKKLTVSNEKTLTASEEEEFYPKKGTGKILIDFRFSFLYNSFVAQLVVSRLNCF